uniref:Cilia- and flagella-associated protein 58 central coiled coil domain-containing protein n=1 Tax=Junco hyemalis TaxID=40217 RepID=A0A8C5IQ98_JUNHY
IDGLVRERDMLNQNLIKAANANQKQIDLMKFHEQSKQNLETEIQDCKIEAQKQRKIIYQLEKERESFIKELTFQRTGRLPWITKGAVPDSAYR